MFKRTLAVGALALGVSAQNLGLSASCQTYVLDVAVANSGSGIGQCLALSSLLPVVAASGSVVDSLNSYLGSLCTAPQCDNSTLTTAETNVKSSCSSDISGGGTAGTLASALIQVLENYPEFYTAACSKNSTTGEYCVTSTLSAVQNATGQSLTLSYIEGLLAGSSSDTTALTSVASSGVLCTGCVQSIYEQAVKANSSIASSEIGQGLSSQCGASFVDTSSTPSGVSTAAVTATSAAVTASTSSAARRGSLAPLGSATAVMSLGAFGVMALVGGALVL